MPFLKFAAKPLPLRAHDDRSPGGSQPQRRRPRHPHVLFAFAIFYGGMVCIAGVLGNKQVALGPLAVEAGIFAFLMLVVTSSAVAELHGRAIANRLVLFGFVPLIVSLVLSFIVLALPAPPTWTRAARAFETVMGGTPRIWLGGILAYGISTLLNVTIFSRLKAREGSKLLWLRADRQRAQPDRRHADLHHGRFLRRLPDRRAAAGPDAGEGRAVGMLVPLADLSVRGASDGDSIRLARSRLGARYRGQLQHRVLNSGRDSVPGVTRLVLMQR